MPIQAVLLPLFVQVLLTFGLMYWMAYARTGAVRSKQTRMADIALGQLNWPPRVQQISNCYASQFQLPVLFYLLTVLVIVTRHADIVFVVMAWLFVFTRLVHVYIHTGSNYVPHRFNAFAVGSLILLMMWLIFIMRIVLGLP